MAKIDSIFGWHYIPHKVAAFKLMNSVYLVGSKYVAMKFAHIHRHAIREMIAVNKMRKFFRFKTKSYAKCDNKSEWQGIEGQGLHEYFKSRRRKF